MRLLALALALDKAAPKSDLRPVDHDKVQAQIEQGEAELEKMEAADKKMMAGPSSLLEKGAPKWTEKDAAATEDLLSRSYKQIDSVQDAIIKAADQELQEQKSLPTLEQATHHWHADQWGPTPASLLQTGAKTPLDDEYAQAIDFSKLDKLRSRISNADVAMKNDFHALKVQASKDAAFAKQEAKDFHPAPASLSEGPGDMIPRSHIGRGPRDPIDAILPKTDHPVDFDEMAQLEAQQERRAERKAHEQRAAAKLQHVQGKLALLERVLETEMAHHDSPQLEQKLHKLKELLAMSKAASGVVASVDGHQAPQQHEQQLNALRQIKSHLQAFAPHEHFKHRAEIAEHVREMAQQLRGVHLGPAVPGSLVQDAPASDDGYAPIEQGLESLEQRIQSQVKDLKEKEKQQTTQQVNTLGKDAPGAYKFDLSQPSYLEVDAKGNMRTH